MGSITSLPNTKFSVDANHDIFHTQKKQEKSFIKTVANFAWNAFSLIVFPVGVARLSLAAVRVIAAASILPAVSRYSLSSKEQKLKQLINRQQDAPSKEIEQSIKSLKQEITYIKSLHDRRERFLSNPANHATQNTIEAADQTKLDTVAIENSMMQQKPPSEQKWVIFNPGNAMCYEEILDAIKELSDATGASYLLGNYRGVMRSKGAPEVAHDLVLDGEAMVQYLLQKGVPKENILIHGISLGGGVGTAVAANHQGETTGIHLFNDRSFSSLTDAIKGLIPNIFGKIGASLASPAGWQLDSVANYEKIKGKKVLLHAKGDGVIRYSYSLYKGVKEVWKKQNRMEKPQAIKVKIDEQAFAVSREMSLEDAQPHFGLHNHCFAFNEYPELFKHYVTSIKTILNISDSPRAI